MDKLIGCLYICLLGIMLTYELRRKKFFYIDALSFFHFYFALSYIVPGALWCFTQENDLWYKYYFDYNAAADPLVFFTIAFSYFVVSATFYIFSRVSLSYRLFVSTRGLTTHSFHLYAFFIFSLILVSAISAGGIVEYIQKGINHRHRADSYGVGTYLKYFIYPVSLFLIGYFYAIKKNCVINKVIVFSFYFIFLIFSLVFLVSTGGRGNILNFAVLVFLFYLLMKGGIDNKALMLSAFGVIASAFIMTYYREITFAFGRGRATDILNSEFSPFEMLMAIFTYYRDVYYSIFLVFEDPGFYNYPRLGLDSLRVLFSIVPGTHIDDYNVAHVTSVPDVLNIEKFQGGPGYIPPGWVAFALMNGGFYWLFFKCILVGLVGAFVSKGYFLTKNGLVLFGYFSIFFLWYRFSFMGAVLNYGQNSLGFYFYIIFLLFAYKIRLKRV